jgi:hypothetical protein
VALQPDLVERKASSADENAGKILLAKAGSCMVQERPTVYDGITQRAMA